MERKLSEYLVEAGLINRQALQRCILQARVKNSSVVAELTKLGGVDGSELARHLASFYDCEYIDVVNLYAQPYALKLISGEMAEAHGILPFEIDTKTDRVKLALYDPVLAREVIDSIEISMGKAPTIVIMEQAKLEKEIFRHYRANNDDATPPASEETPVSKPRIPILIGEEGVGAEDSVMHADTREFTVKDQEGGGNEAAAQFVIEGKAKVDEALNAFDSLLNNSDKFGAGDFGVPSAEWELSGSSIRQKSLSGLGLADARDPFFSGAKSDRAEEELDLFDLSPLPGPAEHEYTLKELLEANRRTIHRLEREIDHQRNVLQTLADLLVEARVLSRKELKTRLRALRQKKR